jgi:transketolase
MRPGPREDAVAQLQTLGQSVREHVLRLATRRTIHIGAALSAADILVAVHFGHLRNPPAKARGHRDRCILSKGHGVFALYGTLLELGVLPRELFEQYGRDDCVLAGHPVDAVPGIEVATGGLGHGLSIGAGLALAAQLDGADVRTVVVLGDGELDEGSVWEALAFIAHRSIPGLIPIVDANGLQQEGPTAVVLNMEPLDEKFRAFGFDPVVIDGHDPAAILGALGARRGSRPPAIIARTIKGKGVSFMEHSTSWHMNQLDGPLFERALIDLRGGQ